MAGVQVHPICSDEAALRIAAAYWEINADGTFAQSVAQIARSLGIKQATITAALKSAHVECDDLECPSCGLPHVVANRTEFESLRRKPDRECSECIELRNADARDQRQIVDHRRRAVVDSRYATEDLSDDLDLGSLPLLDALFLAAYFRTDSGIAEGSPPPIAHLDHQLMPSSELAVSLLRSLYKRGDLRIHPASQLEAFCWEDDDTYEQFFVDRARYQLTGRGAPADRARKLIDFTNRLFAFADWPDHWRVELAHVWRTLAVHDCETYLVFQLRDHSLEFSPGPQTRELFERLSRRFCLAELYYFIWSAAKNASSSAVSRHVTKKQAANSAISRIAHLADRAFAESWEVQKFRRDSRLPWPAAVAILNSALSSPDPMTFHPDPERLSHAKKLNWSLVTDSDFERLIYDLLSQASGYSNVDWLMHTNAPDRGRDISAFRRRSDELSGDAVERVIVQCKHWLKKSIGDGTLADETTSVEHWDNPPVDVLIVATSGKFTADAIAWTERRNGRGNRPRIELWNDAKLEMLLSTRRHLAVEYGIA